MNFLMLIQKLKETKCMRIFKFKRGFEKAVELLQKGEEKGVFCMSAEAEVLAEGPGLYLLAGYCPVKEEYMGITGVVRKSNASSVSIRGEMTQ